MTFPSSVANLVAHWHAEDLALSENDPVQTLPDRINGHDLAQATLARRPLFKPTAGPFSKPAIQFDGVDDFLDAPFHVELNPVAFTFFAKVSVLDNPSGVRGVQSSRNFDTGNMTGYLVYAGVADDTWQAWYGRTGTTEATSVDSAVAENVFSALAFRASATQGGTLYVDGTPGTTGANFTAPNTASPFRLGAGAAESPSGDFFTNMLLTEAFFYNRRLSDTEIAELTAYLEAQHESGAAVEAATAVVTAGAGRKGGSGSASVSATAQAVAQGAKGAAGTAVIGSDATLAGTGDGIESPSGTGEIVSVASLVAIGSKSVSGTASLAILAALSARGGAIEDVTASSTLGDDTATSFLGNIRSNSQVGATLATTYADRTANP